VLAEDAKKASDGGLNVVREPVREPSKLLQRRPKTADAHPQLVNVLGILGTV
jgi:hypothetical protein